VFSLQNQSALACYTACLQYLPTHKLQFWVVVRSILSELGVWPFSMQSISPCPARKPTPENLNYPSITALFAATTKVVPSSKTFVRTVMNVGPKRSVYVARVKAPKGVTVTVKPAMLAFADGVTKRSFMVTVTADTRNLVLDDSGAMFGSLSWSDGTHVVRTEV
jgi:hypothetical protein